MDVDSLLDRVGTPCTVDGITEKTRITRLTKASANSVYAESLRRGRFKSISSIKTGSLVSVSGSEEYFVRALYINRIVNNIKNIDAQMVKINATTNTLRYSESYDEFGNAIPGSGAWKDTVTEDAANLTPVKAFAEWISAAMRQAEPGLLSTTVIRLYVQATNVMQLLDRVMLGDKPYQLDAIDPLSNPGLAVVQLSQDNRG